MRALGREPRVQRRDGAVGVPQRQVRHLLPPGRDHRRLAGELVRAVDVADHRRHQERVIQARVERAALGLGAAGQLDDAELAPPRVGRRAANRIEVHRRNLGVEVSPRALDRDQRQPERDRARAGGQRDRRAGAGRGPHLMRRERGRGARDEVQRVAAEPGRHPAEMVELPRDLARGVIDGDRRGVDRAALQHLREVHDERAGRRKGEPLDRDPRRGRELDRDAAVERDPVVARRDVLVGLGEAPLVVDHAGLARIERERGHHGQHAVVGRARAVEVDRREPADAIVLGVVAREVLEADGPERAVGIGPGLGEPVRRDRADKAAAIREAEAPGPDPRIDPRGGVGDLGQRRRHVVAAGGAGGGDQG